MTVMEWQIPDGRQNAHLPLIWYRRLQLIACRQSRVKPADYSRGPTGGLPFLFVLRSLHRPPPTYQNYLQPHCAAHTLGSNTVDPPSVPRTCLKTEGAQALEAAAPEPWSALPAPSPSVDSFCFVREGAKQGGLTFYISHTRDLQTYFTLVLNGLNASLAC